MNATIPERPALAARFLTRRLMKALGARVVSVQVVGQNRRGPRPAPGARDLDILVILTELEGDMVKLLRRIEEEIEAEFAAGLAVEVTSPSHIESLGERGTPVWRLLDSGVPLLEHHATPLLPDAAPTRTRRLSRPAARRRAHQQLEAARTLLQSGLTADAISSAYQSMRTQALAWLPADALQGQPESAVMRIFLDRVPGGPEGILARRVLRARKLREDLDFGCQAAPERSLAFEVVRDAEQLYATLFAGVAPAEG